MSIQNYDSRVRRAAFGMDRLLERSLAFTKLEYHHDQPHRKVPVDAHRSIWAAIGWDVMLLFCAIGYSMGESIGGGGYRWGDCWALSKMHGSPSSSSLACARASKPVQDPSWQLPGCHCAKHAQAARPENKGWKVSKLSVDWHCDLPSIHRQVGSVIVLGEARGAESLGESSLLERYCIHRE